MQLQGELKGRKSRFIPTQRSSSLDTAGALLGYESGPKGLAKDSLAARAGGGQREGCKDWRWPARGESSGLVTSSTKALVPCSMGRDMVPTVPLTAS